MGILIRRLIYAFFLFGQIWAFVKANDCTKEVRAIVLAAKTDLVRIDLIEQGAGPGNNVLTKLAAQAPHDRNPRFVASAKRSKDLRIEDFVEAIVGIMSFSDNKYTLEVARFIDFDNPMASKMFRDRIFISGMHNRDPRVIKWLSEQYPDYIEELQRMLNPLRVDGMGISASGQKSKDFVDNIRKWVVEYKTKHGDNIAIVPLPRLTNRVAEQVEHFLIGTAAREQSKELLRGGREYSLESIQGLFHPEQYAKHIDEVRELVHFLTGKKIYDANDVKIALEWVLTQYPELQRDASKLSLDDLKQLFGSHLVLIPARGPTWEWVDLSKRFKTIQLDEGVGQKRFLNITHALQTLKAPTDTYFDYKIALGTGIEKAFPRPGDKISAPFKLKSTREKYQKSDYINGIVEKIVVDDQGRSIGVQLRRNFRIRGEEKSSELETYLYRDLEIEGAKIAERAPDLGPVTTVKLSEIPVPEDSGAFTLRVGSSRVQTPVSVGDEVSITYDGFRGTMPGSTEKRPLVLTTSGFVKAILRDEKGNAYGLEIYEAFHRHQISEGNVIQLTFDQIKRDSGNSYLRMYSDTENESFVPIKSFKREKYDEMKVWRMVNQKKIVSVKDSGDVMFRIGKSPIFMDEEIQAWQAPLAPKDEVLFQYSMPGTPLGFRYERCIVEEVVFDASGKAIGFKGEPVGGGSNPADFFYRFDRIDMSSSYIETNPWSGKRANSIPGAVDKKQAYQRPTAAKGHSAGAQTRPNFSKIKFEAWEKMPLNFEEWVKKYEGVTDRSAKEKWAYWVLQIDSNASSKEIRSAGKKLSFRFHPDRDTGELDLQQKSKGFRVIQEALEILE